MRVLFVALLVELPNIIFFIVDLVPLQRRLLPIWMMVYSRRICTLIFAYPFVVSVCLMPVLLCSLSVGRTRSLPTLNDDVGGMAHADETVGMGAPEDDTMYVLVIISRSYTDVVAV